MKRPTSLTLLIFFATWSVFKGVESLIRPETTKVLFEEYGVEMLYYICLFIVVFGGGALIYALVNKIEWGKNVGLIWLGTGIFYSVYTGFVSILNKDLMTQIMTTTRESKGRPSDNIAEFVNSTAYDATMTGTTFVMISIMLFFIWKIIQHQKYFLK